MWLSILLFSCILKCQQQMGSNGVNLNLKRQFLSSSAVRWAPSLHSEETVAQPQLNDLLSVMFRQLCENYSKTDIDKGKKIMA